MQASSDDAHCIIKKTVNEASVSTATPYCAQYSDLKYTVKKVAICSVFVSTPHPDPAFASSV